MTTTPEHLLELTAQIRRSFWELKAVSDAIVADLGLTASTRSILEFLDAEGPCTVPQIAAAKTITRQSVQSLVDQLAARDLVQFKPNPAHRRSQLVALTTTGTATFAEIRRRDLTHLQDIAQSLPPADIATAVATLESLRRHLEPLIPRDRNSGED